MKKIFLLFLLFFNVAFGEYMEQLVKNEEMARNLAEIFIKNKYGTDLADRKPYNVRELEAEWEITGQGVKDINGAPLLGGSFKIKILKKNGGVSFIKLTK